MDDQERLETTEHQAEGKGTAEVSQAGALRVRTGIRAGGDEDVSWGTGGDQLGGG
jgi:hypothetical protein